MITAGFIGLGSQGAGIAHRIIEMGIPTRLWARRTEALEPFIGQATFADDPADVGRSSDVVGLCVSDGAAVRAVALGPRGALAGMAKGSVLAIHSTIGIEECREVADAAAVHGVSVIDAPVSGGGAVAAAGTLTVYVGGDGGVVARARTVLEAFGKPVLQMGPLGSGLRTKFLNNALSAAQFALAHDAMEIGIGAGLDPGALGKALQSGSGRSFSLEVLLAMGSLDVFAEHVGPIMSKDMMLFAQSTDDTADRAVLLEAADRLLELIRYPRSEGKGAP